MDVDWKDYKNWQQARQRRECQTSGYQTVRIFTRQSASQDSINLEGLDNWQQARHRRGCQTTICQTAGIMKRQPGPGGTRTWATGLRHRRGCLKIGLQDKMTTKFMV